MRNNVLTLLLAFNCLPAFANIAYVDAFGEKGQSYLFSLGANCYGLVPTHVIKESGGFVSGLISGVPPVTVEGRLLSEFGYDTSVVQYSGHNRGQCGDSYNFQGQDLTTLLSSNQTKGFLKLVAEDGSVLNIPIILSDYSLTHLFIKTINTEDQLLKGFSGSSIFINNKYVGMLLSIQKDGITGKVIRSDRAFETVNPLFTSKVLAGVDVSNTQRGKKALKGLDYTIDSWTSKVAVAEGSIENLKNSESGINWVFKPKKMPSELIISFNEPTRIKAVSFGTSDKVGDTSAVRQVEIFGRKTKEGRWRSLRGGGLSNQGADMVTFSMAPTKVQALKFKIYSNYGAQLFTLGTIIIQ